MSSFENDQNNDAADDSKFLLFTLGNERYGTPLLGVREVVEPQKAKSVPNTVEHFMGLINLRGQIIGVVELRKRFGYAVENTAGTALLVFDTEAGPLAAVVDHVEAVIKIDINEMAKKPNIRSQVPVEFLLGAINYDHTLVTLIDLSKTLSAEDYVALRTSKLAAG